MPPRDRTFDSSQIGQTPAKITLGDKEFFDDPLSGPVFPSKSTVSKTQNKSKPVKTSLSRRVKQVDNEKSKSNNSDPWSKWRKS